MTILISGFEPFEGISENVSELVCRQLPAKVAGHSLTKIILPVSFAESWEVLNTKLNEFSPDAILSLGQASPRTKISVERVALNWIDSRIPDNSGQQPKEQAIEDDEENARFSNLPFADLKPLLNSELCETSYFAGTYVCNYIYFKILGWSKNLGKPALFAHLPLCQEQLSGQKVGPTAKALATEVEKIAAWLVAIK